MTAEQKAAHSDHYKPRGIAITLNTPDFGTCRNCAEPLIMLRLLSRESRERYNRLVAACPKCDVVQVRETP